MPGGAVGGAVFCCSATGDGGLFEGSSHIAAPAAMTINTTAPMSKGINLLRAPAVGSVENDERLGGVSNWPGVDGVAIWSLCEYPTAAVPAALIRTVTGSVYTAWRVADTPFTASTSSRAISPAVCGLASRRFSIARCTTASTAGEIVMLIKRSRGAG